jgi:hypothetical protein
VHLIFLVALNPSCETNPAGGVLKGMVLSKDQGSGCSHKTAKTTARKVLCQPRRNCSEGEGPPIKKSTAGGPPRAFTKNTKPTHLPTKFLAFLGKGRFKSTTAMLLQNILVEGVLYKKKL